MTDNTYDCMMMIYRHAEAHMTQVELKAVGSSFTEEAANLARRLDGVLQGIACLVLDDAKRPDPVGSFQNGETVFNLLCATAQQLNIIAALVDVGTEATWQVRELEHQGRKAS